MAGPFAHSRCVLLVLVCLAAGGAAVATEGSIGFRVAVPGVMAGALTAVACLAWRLRETRLALDRAGRAKSQLLSNVSHELRTPLHGVHGMAQLLARECQTREQRQMASAIEASCESLLAVVDQMIGYARLERGELKAQLGPFDLREAVADIAAAVATKAEAKGLAFTTVVELAVPHLILGDAWRLREVLRSLLDNAVKFTPEGEVRLEVSVGGDRRECRAILFRVCDTGPGIEPETARSLFTAFTQGDGASTRAHGGLGLGLTMAFRLVGLMGGSMDVESQPGRGSVFWFLLPTVPVEPSPAATAGATASDTRYGRILVVDDNPINQLVAVRAGHSLGYSADAVPSGKAALEALRRTRYDAVLMDCQMPGMDGFQTALEIRRQEAGTSARIRVPIIAMTANDPGADREHCLASGMDDYLTKPFRIAQLDSTLQRWIGARGASVRSA
jgi:signal transduction histidine kinase/ActR/RegA family two-component response regulator